MKLKIHILCVLMALVVSLAKGQSNSEKLITKAAEGDLELCQHYLSEGANVNHRNRYEETPLFMATLNKEHKVMKYLLENGALTTSVRRDKTTPLMLSCYIDDYEGAYLLARHTKNLDAQDFNRATALHYAIYSGNVDMVEMLLHYGADPNIKTKADNTPLHLAMYIKDTLLCELLLEKGAKLHEKNIKLLTPIMIAAQQNNTEVFQYLHRKGADIQYIAPDSLSPLAIAVVNQNTELISYLLPIDSNAYRQNQYHNPRNIAQRALTVKERQQFSAYGYNRNWKNLEFQSSVHLGGMVNSKNHHVLGSLAFTELNNRVSLAIGYSSRIKVKEVIVRDETEEGKEYDEIQPSIDITLRKYFPVRINLLNDIEFGAYIGLSNQFQIEPEVDTKKYFIRPHGGLYLHYAYLDFNLGYSYAQYNYAWISPHYFQVGISYNLYYYHREWLDAYLPTWF